jgi:hypothetical protein
MSGAFMSHERVNHVNKLGDKERVRLRKRMEKERVHREKRYMREREREKERERGGERMTGWV